MARSMTGFGRAQYSDKRYAAEVEIRSLNNRFLKVRVHAPASISIIEAEVEDFLRSKLSRGAVDVWIRVTEVSPADAYKIDLELVRRYREFAATLTNDMGIQGHMQVADFMNLPGVVSAAGEDSDAVSQLRPVVMDLMGKALAQLEAMRGKEGEACTADIRRRAGLLSDIASKVKGRVPAVVSSYRDRLLQRVRELLSGSGVEIAQEDLIKEVSIFAERSDISEELSRIDSHLIQLVESLEQDDDAGRKLEFVAQELHREINTIGSKANDAEISRLVVDAKGEVDRIREQSANLE
jgi:uncharacterized protein (TIGR00255 family)